MTVFTQSLTGGQINIQNDSAREELAQQFNSGHVLIGQSINACTWWLKKNDNPTGNLYAYVRNADATTLKQSTSSLDVSTLTTSFAEYSFSFAGTNTMPVDGYITACLNNGETAGSNYVYCSTGSGDMTNGTLFKSATCGSGYVNAGAEQMTMSVTYGATPPSTGTRLPPPPIILGGL